MSGAGIAASGGHSMAALELLANPDQLQKRIDSLKAAEEAAQKQIELAGPAAEILQIRSQIDGELESAKQAAADAVAKGEELVQTAREEAMEIRADAEADASRTRMAADARKAEADKLHDDAAASLATSEQEAKRLLTWEAALGDKEEALDNREADLDNLNSELLKEKSELGAAVEQIKQLLG